MLGEPKWIGGADVRVREVRLEMQERLQRSPRFRFPRRVPKRGNQPVVGTDILWLSVDRVCRSSNSTVDVAKHGDKYQLVFELRPAHDPTKAYGFVNCVVSLENLSSSIWTWYKDGDKWAVKKVIEIPAEPASEDQLPPLLKGFKAVPPLCTDIDLSMDDKFLYVACWGTGDLQQYDVSDPFKPKLTGKVRIGGIVSRATHPGAKNGALSGGPQMVEISRDGKRVYFTNSLYGAIDPQFYPDGIEGWMVKLDARPEGGIAFDPKFFVKWPAPHRPHQVRLEGGDCSSDSYCYP